MTTKKVIAHTRPFQAFLIAADSLLELAKPYNDIINQEKDKYKKSKIVVDISTQWQLEKSLSIASFLTKYAGLEAFLNCIYEDFSIRTIGDLPDDVFEDFDKDVISSTKS